MDIWALIDAARQGAPAARAPTKCRICQCDIAPESRRGRPRLTCGSCAVFQAAALHPRPRQCERCKKEFWPEREVARFCCDGCRRAAGNERRRYVYTNATCRGCGTSILGRARRYCATDCRRQHRNALKRKGEAPSERHCPECQKPFMPWRAGVIYCCRTCAKRRADRNHCARRRAARRNSVPGV